MSKVVVPVGNIPCGGPDLFLIAGPCVIEERDVMFRSADTLAGIQDRLGIRVIYKSSFLKDNRSTYDGYRGPGLEAGLQLLQQIKAEYGFPLLSDVHYPEQVPAAAEVLDVLQIPAYLCMQTTLLVDCAHTGRVINIKRGQFLSPENIKLPLEKAIAAGNDQVILTERGYVFGYNDLVVDPRSFYLMAQTGYPVIFDITHSIRRYGIPSSSPLGGNREFLPTLGRAGVAAGVDGIFVETHPHPQAALCDAASQVANEHLEEYLKPLIAIHNLVRQWNYTLTP
jgi:2-dehydro-3-deoxyphosphooctonate aldolase (KDO 8-P synthase)